MKAGKDPEATVVADSALIVMLVCVAGGAVLGWVVKLLARWLVSLPWAPFQGPAKLLNSFPEPGLTVGVVAVGALAGLLLGLTALHESLTVTVSDTQVTLSTRDETQVVERGDIALAFKDGKQLVLLGHHGGEAAREETDLSAKRLSRAFTKHGYGWADADPHDDAYRLWVPGASGLPDGANAVLAARAKALKADKGGDARELRKELARFGVVVRDRDKRQYWRM
ncbi:MULTISPECIES: YqeB family protein [unclassified Nonomuraea]